MSAKEWEHLNLSSKAHLQMRNAVIAFTDVVEEQQELYEPLQPNE